MESFPRPHSQPGVAASFRRRCFAAALALLCGFSAAATAQEGCRDCADRAKLDRRLEQALQRHRNVEVVYQDVLGEGRGHWDPDPLYPTGPVNCIVWLYLLLADTYGSTPAERAEIMKQIRYYDGQVAFGTRKHYTDHWMGVEPEPLVRKDLSACPGVRTHEVRLDFQRFLRSVGYQCPLYRMEQTTFEIPFLTGDGLRRCAAGFRPGYYVVFPLASDRYLEKYGANSGPMGQVHAVLLKVAPLRSGAPPGDGSNLTIYHASISSGRVIESRLPAYVEDMVNLFRGYAVYELDPYWNWKAKPGPDKEIREIQACEARLKGNVGQMFKPKGP
jgi:Protein of unknown function (DUF1460)